MNICIQIFIGGHKFPFPWVKCVISGSCCNFMLFFKKKVFQRGCFLAFFYHQFMSHPTFPRPCKHLVLSLHILAIPLGKKSYLTKAVTYILFQLTFSK